MPPHRSCSLQTQRATYKYCALSVAVDTVFAVFFAERMKTHSRRAAYSFRALRVCKEHRKMTAARMTLPCDSRWRALLTSCVVTARSGLDANDSCLLLRLTAALKQMDAGSAHAVLNALALPRAGA